MSKLKILKYLGYGIAFLGLAMYFAQHIFELSDKKLGGGYLVVLGSMLFSLAKFQEKKLGYK